MDLRVSWTVFHKRGLEGFRNEFFQKVFRLNMGSDLKLCVAFPWVETSTGPGGFMICVFII